MNKKINSCISELLYKNDCVVIPGFGGFVANIQAATIDKRTNSLHPASKSIVFNKSLNNNDGLLTNEVAVNEGITFKQAQKNIEDYVAYLNDSLHLHKKVFLEEIGTLLLVDNQNIIFVQSTTSNHLLDSYGYSTIQFSAIERENNPIQKQISQFSEKPVSQSKRSWLKAAAVAIPFTMLCLVGFNNQEKIKTSYASLIPINKTEIKEAPKPKLSHQFSINSTSKDIEQAIRSYYQLQQNMETEIAFPKYFVVAGSFKSKKNAKKLVKKLAKWNFNNAQVMEKSKNGFYRVCYTSHFEKEQALNSLNKIKKSNPSAWLFSLK